MRKKFSIRYKFLLATTLLLLFCVGVYLVMASRVFKLDKTEMVYDFNRSLVTNISSDVETTLRAAVDKMRLVAYFYREQDRSNLALMGQVLQSSKDLVFVGGSDDFQNLDKSFYVDELNLKTYRLEKGFFAESLVQLRPIPFEEIRRKGQAIWNASTENGPPLMGIAKSVTQENSKGEVVSQYAVIGFLKADKVLQTLAQAGQSEVLLINSSGQILVHRDAKVMTAASRVTEEDIFEKFAKSNLSTQVLSYERGGEKVLGAISKAFAGEIFVMSRISEARAFHVVEQLVTRSISFALLVLTLAFIAAVVFSRSLTKPIEVLVGGMKKVAEGHLETRIDVSSRDEIKLLADSFNLMIKDLQQSRQELEEINRDLEKKVKERTLQLERQNQAVKNAQEALLRTTRLASIGEIAGRAAHEVLNPLTSIVSRLEKLKARVKNEVSGELQLMDEITTSWQKDYENGGMEQLKSNWLQPSTVDPSKTLWQEDLENFQAIYSHLSEGWDQVAGDTDFLIRESQRINRIVQSMRSLSVVKGEMARHSVSNLLQEAIDIMADLASQKDIKVITHFEHQCDDIHVDKDEFVQSLTNLLRNAFQAIEENPTQQGEVSIGTRSNEQGFVEVFIKDNGVGIDEENIPKLFESQFSTKSREEGTGLGLNISRRFVRAFGGDIQLHETRRGLGTTFVIRLPEFVANDLNKETA